MVGEGSTPLAILLCNHSSVHSSDFIWLHKKINFYARGYMMKPLATKPLAPFGEYLNLQILNGVTNEIVLIFMGINSYQRAADFQAILPYTLSLPPRTSPYRYNWSVNGYEVFLADTSRSNSDFVNECVVCFFTHGATRVTYIPFKSSPLIFEKE